MRGLRIWSVARVTTWRMTFLWLLLHRQELQKELEEKREEEEPSLLLEILSFKIERARCSSLCCHVEEEVCMLENARIREETSHSYTPSLVRPSCEDPSQ